ncbi:MAG: hypothetical protein A2Y76_14660, partial [Planctomycetes bacterium RBG_13_60_9]
GAGISACRYGPVVLPLGTNNEVRQAGNAASTGWAEPMDLPGLPNLHRVSNDLYRGAQPTAAGITELKKLGVRTIVNLRENDSDRDLLGDTGLVCLRIPMTAFHPKEADVVRFLQIVTDESCTPVFLHCQRGADRTGMMTAIYRVAVQGWTKEDALAEMTQGGFAFNSGWQNLVRYVRDLDIDRIKQQSGLTQASLQPSLK